MQIADIGFDLFATFIQGYNSLIQLNLLVWNHVH